MKGESQPQVAPAHYGPAYDTRRRYLSYWNQLHLITERDPGRILEVGIGSGFLARQLRVLGHDLHTADFDARLMPDTVADVTELPFSDRTFDTVCCFETLEHLPFEAFVPALRELARVSSGRVLFSVPDVTPYLRLLLALGSIRAPLFDRAIERLSLFPKRHVWDGQHHWEIGKRGYPRAKIERAIGEAGLSLERTLRDYDDPYHRAFVCAATR